MVQRRIFINTDICGSVREIDVFSVVRIVFDTCRLTTLPNRNDVSGVMRAFSFATAEM